MITDTNGDIFPEGTYTFRVCDIPNEIDIKGYVAWQWAFEAVTDEGLIPYHERFMVWLMAPVLRGLGFMEVSPGKFEWEPSFAINRKFSATVKHVTLEKGASAGKVVARMVDIVPLADHTAPMVGSKHAKKSSVPSKETLDIPF